MPKTPKKKRSKVFHTTRKKSLSSVPKSAKAKTYHETVFLPILDKKFKELNEFPITVFLCGPSKSSNLALYKKRKDIEKTLKKLCIDAFLGEDIVRVLKKKDKDNGRDIKPLNVYEKEIALKADLVIIFHEGIGAITESCEFLNIKTIERKTYIWLNKKYENRGYNSQGILKQHKDRVITYNDPQDIVKCNLKTEVVEKALSHRNHKWNEKKLK